MSSPNNLPGQLTSFIGREQEIAEVKLRLASSRLLILTGIGGTGKTRLMLRVAADLLADYSGGVWFVDLAKLGDPTLVLQAVGSELGVREEAQVPLIDTLSNHIRPLETLILLDNCEHLVEACCTLADTLLRSCPKLCIFATSRQALGVPGEAAWPVPPLSSPNPLEKLPVESMLLCDAVQLFVQRAMLRRLDFALTPDNAQQVAQLCSQLEGLPLAIELAAARISVLSVGEIVNRLDERLRLLTSRSYTVPSRQQTLTALMDWSYDLLAHGEQALLRGLAVFAGGFTREAVEAVVAGELDEYEMIELLSQLVNKSLVITEAHESESRYRLLETVRQYAWEKLRASGETLEMRSRHRSWCLQFAEWVAPELQGPQQVDWLDKLETEYDNLRAALQWTLGDSDSSKTEEAEEATIEVALRLVAALWYFWLARGHWSEGRKWLEGALALSESAAGARLSLSAASSRASTLYAAGWLATRQSDYAHGAALLEQSLSLSLEIGYKRGAADSLGSLSWLAMEQGDYEQARVRGEEGLAVWRELGDKRGIALVLHRLGYAALGQGNMERAKTMFEESIATARELKDTLRLANSLIGLGDAMRQQKDWNQATPLYEEALELFRQLRRKGGVAAALANLGMVTYRQGNYKSAQALFSESLTLSRELGSKYGSIYCLAGLAGVRGAQGQSERATRILGAANALLQATSIQLEPPDRVEYDSIAAAVRRMTGETAFSALEMEGQALTLEQAIEYALQPPQASGVGDRELGVGKAIPDSRFPPPGVELTKRELEVLRLIADGLTNPEIALQLSLSVHTVEAHLRSVYGKLGVTTRNAAARYAHQNNLF